MKRLQNAQKKLNEITLTFMAINGVLADIMDDANTIKKFEVQIAQVGRLLDSVAALTGSAIDDITLGAQEAVREMMEEGRYE